MLSILTIAGFLFTDLFSKCMKKAGIMQDMDEFVVNEELGTYFECVSLRDRKKWVAAEVHASNNLGISTMGTWTQD